jgi:hypothetical protein
MIPNLTHIFFTINFLILSKVTGGGLYKRVYQKYSGLVPPSIQQVLCHEAPVDGRTTISSESVCQVARSWVDVCSFHMCLVVMFVIFTASVWNILDTPS